MIGSEFTAIVGATNVSDSMQQAAAKTTADAAIRYNNYIDISRFIKETFEKVYGGSWQCIVGKSFSW
ncbi:unnamed protein product [Hymenolepis diminuta]|uniref:Dynein light chain n=1 Tax=Hymenolepis diminuta TaxID=6216 RepID=A0A0R3SNT2_HYMDI|nr:unnamed protein product [Hymenolepis diminuta]